MNEQQPTIYGVQGTDALLRAAAQLNEGEQAGGSIEWITAPTLFTLRRMAVKGEDFWGIRHEAGYWLPLRYRTEEQARGVLDAVLLSWLEGEEVLLVEGFKATVDAQEMEDRR